MPRHTDVPRGFQQNNNYVKLIIVTIENFEMKNGKNLAVIHKYRYRYRYKFKEGAERSPF